ncbi:MAG: GyrI-like domain-containing protein [Rhodospirillales bacterium]|nr:GyrI-like domain-containing protein [Rhodospirillales bacterium]
MQPPKIVEKPAFRLIGIETRTSNAAEMNPATGKIPGLWEKFSFESLPGHITHQTEPGIVYGLYSDFEDGADGAYTLTAGCAVSADAEPPGNLIAREVPAATYAVFTSERGPMPDIVIKAWAEIWAMNSEAMGGERAFSGDFEIYDDRAASTKDAQIDIWISIKR